MNKQFFKPCGGETEEFTVTLQDKALTLEVVNDAEQVVGDRAVTISRIASYCRRPYEPFR
jgi:hypothetical protein